MAITLSCPSCNRRLHTNEEYAGRTMKCPNCQSAVTIPTTGIKVPPLELKTERAAPPLVPPVATKQLFCTNCGGAVSEQAFACTACGAKPIGHKKFCRHCAAPLNPEQVVCVKCGSEIKTAGVSQLLDQSKNLLNNSRLNGITVGNIIIFVSTALALISFFLPWIELRVPMGRVSGNGFDTQAFLFGSFVFILPVSVALSRKKTIASFIVGYACAGLGLLYGGFVHKEMFLAEQLEIARSSSRSFDGIQGVLSKMGPGTTRAMLDCTISTGNYLYIFACLLLIVGIALQHRTNWLSKSA